MVQGVGRLSIALLSASNICLPVYGFLHSTGAPTSIRSAIVQRLSADEGEGGAARHRHRWKHEPFDFSSKIGWDKFYKDGLNQEDTTESTEVGDGDDAAVESLEYEWHPHIPHSAIVEAIEPAISAASQHSKNGNLPSILLVGCGNSALPRVLHDAFDVPVQVACLDYSPVCIDMIQSMYEQSCPNMDFVVGDATNLQAVNWEGGTEKQSTEQKHFDVIVDKGLMDALMCGDGFDMERLMGSVNDVLTPSEWGMHVLICFELSKASKQSLNEFGRDNEPSVVWDFGVPVEGSEKGRATFNMAQRCRPEGKGVKDIESIATEWT